MRMFLCLTVVLGAVMGASAQNSAEEIMDLMPKMPTEAEMIRYHNETTAPITDEKKVTQPKLYEDFMDALRAAQSKADMMKERIGENGRKKAMNAKVGGTDYTVEELENMSEEEQEKIAMAEAQKRLAAMGINMKDLPKDGNISQAQAQQIAAQAMAKAKSGQLPKADPKIAELQMKLAELGSEEGRLVMSIDNPLKAAAEEGRKLYASNYKAKIEGLEAQQKALLAQGYALSEKFTDEDRPRVEADNKKFQELTRQIWETECDFYSKYIPAWCKAILASMDICKKDILPIEKQRQEITQQLYELTQSPDYAMGDTYPLIAAVGYLEQSEKLTEYDRYLNPQEE